MSDDDQGYFERNAVIAALARLFPSGIARTNVPDWDRKWAGCVYIELPSGQISFHYHDRDAYLFNGLPPYTGVWDGHDKNMVLERLAELGRAGCDPR
jgi:hypothetical protein